MKSRRLLLCALPLALTGCSTMSSVNWSSAYPWNWFGSSTQVTEPGRRQPDGDNAAERAGDRRCARQQLPPAQRHENG